MGSSACATLWFGAILEDDIGKGKFLPWLADDFEEAHGICDVQDWWVHINGQNFDGDYDAKLAWLDHNPVVADEVFIGNLSSGYTQTGLAVKGTETSSGWCDDVTKTVQSLPTAEFLEKTLRDFCAKCKIDLSGCRIGWHLSASYG